MMNARMYLVVLILLSCAQIQGNVQGQRAILSMRHQKQEHNMCVPTAASIVIDYYGGSVSPKEIKKLSIQPNNNFAGTYYSDLVKGIRTIGYVWTIREYPVNDSAFEIGFSEIRHELDKGHPVIVSTSAPPIGHTMVIAGYDNVRKEVYLIDPNRPQPGKRTLTFSEFKNIWHEDISDGRGIILTNPKN